MAERLLDGPGVWRMDTFRVQPGSLGVRETVIDGPEGHHAVDVVRVRRGDLVRLIDGEGTEAVARVDAAERSEAAVSIVEERSHERRTSVHLTVVQALLKGRAFDDVVRRCTELGVAEIVPVRTSRSIGKVPSDAEESRMTRWEAIAVAAVKQSRGVFFPRIGEVRDLGSVGGLVAGHDRALVAWEEETGAGLKQALGIPAPRRILLVVGPEGGLAADEVDVLAASGATPVSVGRRVLRADWAAAAVSAMISCEVGGLLP
ncbi:MAG: RsmE family RNA methyltransferase [Candidatus Eisenbacteria bacterium]